LIELPGTGKTLVGYGVVHGKQQFCEPVPGY